MVQGHQVLLRLPRRLQKAQGDREGRAPPPGLHQAPRLHGEASAQLGGEARSPEQAGPG